MDWQVLSHLLAALLVSIVASIVVLRSQERIAALSTKQAILFSCSLLGLAFLLSLSTTFVQGLLPSPDTRASLLGWVSLAVTAAAFNAAAIIAVAGTLLLIAPSDARNESIKRNLGPTLGILGFGSALTFVGGRVQAGLIDFNMWEVIDQTFYPAACLIIAALLSKRWSQESLSSSRIIGSICAGASAFNYSFGMMHGYFEFLLEVLRGAIGR